MKTSSIKVTPDIAKAWLDTCNKRNRKVSRQHVNKLASEMLAGRWSMNGETIVFDEDMTLIDGQHRLNAVVQSGVSVEMLVVSGIGDPRAFTTTGSLMLRRNANQVAQMMGLSSPNVNNVVAATRIIMAWDKAETNEEFGKYVSHPSFFTFTNEEVSDCAIALQVDLDEAFRRYKNASRIGGSPSMMVALFTIFSRYNPVAAHALFDKLSDGLFKSKNDPAKILYDMLSKGRYPIKNKRLYSAAITIKAFNAISEGRDIGLLRWITEGNSAENFPRIKGAEKK